MEIKIIFRDGIAEKKFKKIEEIGLGETVFYGRIEKKNPVVGSCIIKDSKEKLEKKWAKLGKIIFNK